LVFQFSKKFRTLFRFFLGETEIKKNKKKTKKKQEKTRKEDLSLLAHEKFYFLDVTKTGNGEWGMGNGEWGMR